jgi:hypothetical protein
MKKIIFALLVAAVFLIAAKKQPTRFATPEEMGKALVLALQKNDSMRYLELYPTQVETNTAFVDPWKDSSIYDHQVQWAGKYYKNNNAMIFQQFREVRQEVIKAGINWSTVQFVSIETRKNPKNSRGIDYLYRALIHCTSGERSVDMKLTYTMQTKEGWNCGLGLRVSAAPSPQEKAAQEQRRKADSARMSDSMIVVMMKRQMELEADRLIDSIRMADSLNRADMENRKKPR